MVQAALLTGGRYGQLARLAVDDFHPMPGLSRLPTGRSIGIREGLPLPF